MNAEADKKALVNRTLGIKPAPPRTYTSIVWAQFKRNKPALFSLWLLVLAFHLAIFVPLIANRAPLYFFGDNPNMPAFPALQQLFDRRVWPFGIDVFFNVLLVLYVPVVVLLAACRLLLVGRARRIAVASMVLAVVGGAIGFAAKWDASEPHIDYDKEISLARFRAMVRTVHPGVGLKEFSRVEESLMLAGLNASQVEALGRTFIAGKLPKQRVEALAEKVDALEKEMDLVVDKEGIELATRLLSAPVPKSTAAKYHDPVRVGWLPIPYSPIEGDKQATELTPESRQAEGQGHYLGTDKRGVDVTSRLLYGTRISLTIGIVAVSIFITLGIIIGAVAGYYGGWADLLLSRVIETFICFPQFFMIITVISFLGRDIFYIMVVIGVFGWTATARLIRGEFIKLRNSDFVIAARALGVGSTRTMFRHVLPNAIAPVLVTATFGVAGAILAESGLSFLGFGPVGMPTWGQTLNSGKDVYTTLPHLIMYPGFCIFVVVTLFNLMGEGLRDAIDPKMRQ